MFENYINLVNNKLDEILSSKDCEYSKLFDAMGYSALAGGKRIRPALMMEFTCVCGGNPEDALNLACALEMIHTYSLIHDDLPCMDNDDFRRGRPSCHKTFDEATALLAGDGLLTLAFETALNSKNVNSDKLVLATKVLSECAGPNGMIGGQVIDLKYENNDIPLNAVKDMYRLKTAALLVGAAKIGCIIGGGSDKQISAAAKFAEKIGIAFQIRDDILDIIGTYENLGKPIGSDYESCKSTYVAHVGLDKAQQDVDILTNDAMSLIDIFGDKANNLKDFAISLCSREK